MLGRTHWLSPIFLTFACQRVSFPPPSYEHDDAGSAPGEDTWDPDDGHVDPDLPQRFDAGNGNATDTAGEGCHLVDLLFVIDDSGSMEGEQDNLIASFDGFIAGMREYLVDANDFHVGVITTDVYEHNPPACQTLGGLVTQTAFATCGPFADGKAYMTDEDPLEESFACAAHVGTGGSGWEKPIAATLAALDPGLGEPGACNEGFIRDDALLVLVIITDEDDRPPGPSGGGSPGWPSDWFDGIVQAKGGNETNVVTLALVGTDGWDIPNVCPALPMDENDGADNAIRIIQMVNMFTYGYVGDVCASNYQPFFDDALEVIHTACLGFEPP